MLLLFVTISIFIVIYYRITIFCFYHRIALPYCFLPPHFYICGGMWWNVATGDRIVGVLLLVTITIFCFYHRIALLYCYLQRYYIDICGGMWLNMATGNRIVLITITIFY